MSPHHVFLQRNAGAIAVNHKSTANPRGPPQGSPKPPPPLSRGLRPPCSPRPAAPCALLLFSSGRSRLPHSGRASGAAAGPAAGDRREGSRAGPGAPRSGGEEALKTQPRPRPQDGSLPRARTRPRDAGQSSGFYWPGAASGRGGVTQRQQHSCDPNRI